ncbi:MAG: transposase [Patescibacteria group bacterium]|nr:transposase [Patescibacteria group bacterium]
MPIALIITNGKEHDSKFLIPLCRRLSSYRLKPDYVIADKGYDSEDLVGFIARKLGALASIPIRAKHKQNKTNLEYKSKGRTDDKKIYRKRTSVERTFSYLKNKFNLGKEKTRGITNFLVNVFLSSICLLLESFRGWRIKYL